MTIHRSSNRIKLRTKHAEQRHASKLDFKASQNTMASLCLETSSYVCAQKYETNALVVADKEQKIKCDNFWKVKSSDLDLGSDVQKLVTLIVCLDSVVRGGHDEEHNMLLFNQSLLALHDVYMTYNLGELSSMEDFPPTNEVMENSRNLIRALNKIVKSCDGEQIVGDAFEAMESSLDNRRNFELHFCRRLFQEPREESWTDTLGCITPPRRDSPCTLSWIEELEQDLIKEMRSSEFLHSGTSIRHQFLKI